MKEYPHKCSRCGLCCISQVCQIGLLRYDIDYNERKQPCPGLSFDGDVAVCDIVENWSALKEPMGIGKGCCMKARMMIDGKMVPFAGMPSDIKTAVARGVRNNTMMHMHGDSDGVPMDSVS